MRQTAKEKAILKNMEVLEISREEAEELWAFDNEETDHEDVNKIETKITSQAKETEKRSSLEKVKHMKAKRKGDVHKEAIIEKIFNDTVASNLVKQPMQTTGTKMSFMDASGGFYTVQVTKHKSQPAGYSYKTKEELAAEESGESAE